MFYILSLCKTNKRCGLDPVLKRYNREINKKRIGIELVLGVLKTLKSLLSIIEIEENNLA